MNTTDDLALQVLMELQGDTCYKCHKKEKLYIFYKDGTNKFSKTNVVLLCKKCLNSMKPKKEKHIGGYISVTPNQKFKLGLSLEEDKFGIAAALSQVLKRDIEVKTIKYPKVKSKDGVLLGIYSSE